MTISVQIGIDRPVIITHISKALHNYEESEGKRYYSWFKVENSVFEAV